MKTSTWTEKGHFEPSSQPFLKNLCSLGAFAVNISAKGNLDAIALDGLWGL